MKNSVLKNTILSGLFLALGMVLPLLTSQIKEIGDSLLPMHLVVMFCGIFCGAGNGMAVGFIMPFLRSMIFSMPPLYPNAVWMAFELATYGFVIGILYRKLGKRNVGCLYLSLIISMLSGRIVWAIAKTILLGLGGVRFTFGAFLTGGFIDAFPGIILQLILIPAIISTLNKNVEADNR